MATCEFLEKCSFFNDKMEKMPSAADMMKKIYCQWNYNQCARYMICVDLGKEKLPADLFPGDKVRARVILIQHNYG